MVSTFNTSNAPATSSGSGKSNTLFIVIGLAIAGFVAYKFVIKPMMDKNKDKNKTK